MFSRVLIYKPRWFLIGLVFVLFLLVFPVSAYTQDFSLVSVVSGTWYNGDSINISSLPSCGSYGTNTHPTQINVGYFPDTPWPPTSVGGAWNNFPYTFVMSHIAGYNYSRALIECYDAGQSKYTYVPAWGTALYQGASRPAPSISVSGSPSSGSPLYVSNISINGLNSYFDTVTYFNITAPNMSVYSLSSPYSNVNIDAEGEWIIRATAVNTGGTTSVSGSVFGNAINAPVASFTCSPTNTTSPDYITCTDSSSHIPDSWLWQLTSYGVDMSPGGSYGNGVYSAVNSTQNPVFLMSGSGKVDVRLTASNLIGSDEEYKPEYITIAGVAPTPTSTPNIPWPNQTGVCWRSGISLGSQQIREFYVHYQLTDPEGDTYSGQYYPGEVNIISGQPFFTAVLGVYIYNEYDMTDNSLLWRQSYVVEDCTATSTPTPTGTQVFPTPSVTYTIPTTYPTITIPTTHYTIPTTAVPYPTMTKPSVIQTYSTLSLDFNSSELYNYTITVSPVSKPIVSWLKTWLDGYIKSAIVSFLALIVSPFTYLVSGIPQSTTQLISGLISFAAYPFAILYAIGVFVRNMPEKVRIVFAILLWSNIAFYYFDFFKRGAR